MIVTEVLIGKLGKKRVRFANANNASTVSEVNMNYRKNNIVASWLHVSDLHIFPEADTRLMQDDYKKLAKIISPEFLVVTGDFRHNRYGTNFSLAWEHLEFLIKTFGIDKKDVFLVPGNHDVNHYEGRADAISDICLQSKEENYNAYSKYLLSKGFFDYDTFVREFYSNTDVTDSRITDPSGVHCVVWNNLINILLVNTALISDGDNHGQILDINALSQCQIDFNLPSIMLGHHSIDSLYPCYIERVKGVIDRRKVSAYLHGDSHRYMNDPISMISTPNRTVPSITCAKSAPQSGDSYSDIGVVYYEWRKDDNTYVQEYRWTKNGFIEDSTYYYEINKQYHFPMIYDKPDNKPLPDEEICDEEICDEEGDISISAIAIAPNGLQCVSASSDDSVRLWNIDNRQFVGFMEAPCRLIIALAITPDGSQCIAISREGTMQVWDMATRKIVKTRQIDDRWFMLATITSNGRWCAAHACHKKGPRLEKMLLWDLTSEKGPSLLDNCFYSAMTLTADGGSLIASWSSFLGTGFVEIINILSGEKVPLCWKPQGRHNLLADDQVNAIAVTPDKTCIVLGTCKDIAIWHEGAESAQIFPLGEWIHSIAVSPDGTRLVCGAGSTLYAFDVHTGKCFSFIELI